MLTSQFETEIKSGSTLKFLDPELEKLSVLGSYVSTQSKSGSIPKIFDPQHEKLSDSGELYKEQPIGRRPIIYSERVYNYEVVIYERGIDHINKYNKSKQDRARARSRLHANFPEKTKFREQKIFKKRSISRGNFCWNREKHLSQNPGVLVSPVSRKILRDRSRFKTSKRSMGIQIFQGLGNRNQKSFGSSFAPSGISHEKGRL